MSTEGEKLIVRCKQHILATVRGLPECAPDGAGLRSKGSREGGGPRLESVRAGWLANLVNSYVAGVRWQGSSLAKRGAWNAPLPPQPFNLVVTTRVGQKRHG
jgi:hypothetical protein